MQCARGHVLTVPYVWFQRINMDTPVLPDNAAERWVKYHRWQAYDDDGQPKADGHYFCLDCFYEMMELLERWRQGTSSNGAMARP